MTAHDETTVTVENLKTGELMDFTVKTETENSRWTSAAMEAAQAHWNEPETNVSIRSWVFGDPKQQQNKAHRENAKVLQAEYEQERKIRYIDLTPTWSEAAQIIATALENGTGKGQEMARAELFRMAAILDDLKAEQDAAEKTEAAFFEVVTSATTGQPFRQTFAHKENADAYAAAMQQAGYSAEVSPEFGTQPSFREAMQEAADFYGHPEIMDACKLTAEQEQQP